jgi:hypothetical protein
MNSSEMNLTCVCEGNNVDCKFCGGSGQIPLKSYNSILHKLRMTNYYKNYSNPEKFDYYEIGFPMITKEHFKNIANKYGEFASWAIWADEESTPKSNIGDLSIFDLDKNPKLLDTLNPNVIMVGLNFSRSMVGEPFANFHDNRSQGQDFKIRYAFRGTEFYGAYMTDIIKDFEEKISGNVLKYLKENKDFELMNIRLFEQEILDLKCSNPILIAFGNLTYDLLYKYFGQKYLIKKIIHYSHQISKENYRSNVLETLLEQ